MSTRAANWLYRVHVEKKCQYVVWFFSPSSRKIHSGWRELTRWSWMMTHSLRQNNTAHFLNKMYCLLCVFTKDVFVKMLRVWHHHVSDTYLSSLCPRSLFMEREPAESLLTETQSDKFQERKTSDTQRDVRTRKQTGCRGQDSEQQGGDGPCVCTAACHQRAVKTRQS